jgi:long-chain acyl-CoA synthetase
LFGASAMIATGSAAQPICSIAEADRLLADDPRFATSRRIDNGQSVDRWLHGPTTLQDIAALYRAHGEREFLVYKDERCTYLAALKAAELVADALLRAGIMPGDRVALLMRNRMEWPPCFLGAVLAGGIVVPINGWTLAPEAQAAIADCGARFLFSDRTDVTLPDGGCAHWVVAAESDQRLEALIGKAGTWAALPSVTLPRPARGPDDIAAIFHTSGTTSRPKGATITHRAITATVKNSEYNAARTRLRFPLRPDAPVCSAAAPAALFPIPFFHVSGAIPGLIGSSAIGAKIVMMQRWDVEDALRIIEHERITLIGGVPTMPLQLLNHPRLADYDLSSLTGLLYGGAPAPSRLPVAIAGTLGAEASTGWGMTETASTLLHNSGPDYLLRPGSCGVAVPVNAVRIADPRDAEAPIGTVGELQVRGLNVFAGYWNRPEETAAAFTADGWFRTGDLARIDAEGFVTIVDRAKDIIIRGGENIACIEIEDALSTHPAIVEAAVVGRSHETLGEEPAAFVTLAPGVTVEEEALRRHVAGLLARHKVPVRVIVSADPLPRNPAGKVLKDKLRRIAETELSAQTAMHDFVEGSQ